MRILMVLASEFPPDIRVENEISALQKAGHEIHLACQTRSGRKVYEVTNGLVIHRKPISTFIYKSGVGALRFSFYFRFWKRFLNELISQVKFDAIHIHDLPLASIGSEMAQKTGASFVLDLHEHWPSLLEVSTHTKSFLGKFLSKHDQWMRYELKMCNLAKSIIVISDEFKQRLVGFGVAKEKIHVVSNTLNLDVVRNINRLPKSDHFELFYGGGINRHRGLEIVIDAIPEIIKTIPNFRFKVVGDGNFLGELKRQIELKGIANHVVFTGYQPFTSLMEQLSSSSVSIIPFLKTNHSEIAVPHKIFQYIYMEVPVLASNCSTITRIINETGAGLVYEWNSKTDFVEKIIELYTNYSYWNSKMPKAKEMVLEKYTWQVDSQVLWEIYNSKR